MIEGKTQRKFSQLDAPRLDPAFSALLRAGLSAKNGIASYTVAVSDCSWCQQARACVNEWCASDCVWCGQPIAMAFLDDGEEVNFEIIHDENNLPHAELTRPHRCPEMVEAEKPADKLAAFFNAMESD